MAWYQNRCPAAETAQTCYGLSCVFRLGASNDWHVVWMGCRRWCLNTVEPRSQRYWERKLGLGNPKLFYITINSHFNLLDFQIWIVLILIYIVDRLAWGLLWTSFTTSTFQSANLSNSLLHITLHKFRVWLYVVGIFSVRTSRGLKHVYITALLVDPIFWGNVTK